MTLFESRPTESQSGPPRAPVQTPNPDFSQPDRSADFSARWIAAFQPAERSSNLLRRFPGGARQQGGNLRYRDFARSLQIDQEICGYSHNPTI
jgi:hypothetical protein